MVVFSSMPNNTLEYDFVQARRGMLIIECQSILRMPTKCNMVRYKKLECTKIIYRKIHISDWEFTRFLTEAVHKRGHFDGAMENQNHSPTN